MNTDPQAVSTSASQAGSSWEESASHTASTSQAVSTNPQAVSTSAFQAGSSGKIALLMQPALLPHKQLVLKAVSTQAVSSSQAVSTDPQVVSTSAPRQVVPRKTALLRQPALLPKYTALTPQGASTTLPQAPQASR